MPNDSYPACACAHARAYNDALARSTWPDRTGRHDQLRSTWAPERPRATHFDRLGRLCQTDDPDRPAFDRLGRVSLAASRWPHRFDRIELARSTLPDRLGPPTTAPTLRLSTSLPRTPCGVLLTGPIELARLSLPDRRGPPTTDLTLSLSTSLPRMPYNVLLTRAPIPRI